VRIQRNGLASELQVQRERTERSQRDLSELQHRMARYEDHVRALEKKLLDGIEETKKARIETENLRADFERALQRKRNGDASTRCSPPPTRN
jgi:regulator of replication initiation timing